MTSMALLVGGLLVGLAAANLYWRRRLASVREGLRTAEEWEERGRTDGGSDATREATLRIAAQDAADTAGVPVEELPERVETYEEQARAHTKELERLHDAWVESWWEAATREPVPVDGPRVVTVGVAAGGHDVVRTFAIHAMEVEDEVVVAFDRASGAFAVGASGNLTHLLGADEVADRIVAEAGGGGGGGYEQLATGKAPAEAIDGAVDAVTSGLEGALDASIHPAD